MSIVDELQLVCVIVVADRVFDAESSTLQIYEAHTQDIIASAVQGFNGVFLLACAYSV